MKRRSVGYITLGVGVLVVLAGAFFRGDLLNQLGSSPKLVQQPKPLYIGLGDSVAAGVGLLTASDSSTCDRTEESYPALLAAKMQYQLRNLACSGATIGSGISGPQEVNQLELASQLDTLSGTHPSVVTLTIGANDVGWLEALGQCYRATCGTPSEQFALEARMDTLRMSLGTVLEAIRARTPETTQVIVVGYYRVFPDGMASCTDLTGIDANELAWGQQVQDDLNTILKQTVEASSTATAYVEADFRGHELCTSESWVQGLADTAPYHPSEAGQAAIAHALEDYLKKGR